MEQKSGREMNKQAIMTGRSSVQHRSNRNNVGG